MALIGIQPPCHGAREVIRRADRADRAQAAQATSCRE